MSARAQLGLLVAFLVFVAAVIGLSLGGQGARCAVCVRAEGSEDGACAAATGADLAAAREAALALACSRAQATPSPEGGPKVRPLLDGSARCEHAPPLSETCSEQR